MCLFLYIFCFVSFPAVTLLLFLSVPPYLRPLIARTRLEFSCWRLFYGKLSEKSSPPPTSSFFFTGPPPPPLVAIFSPKLSHKDDLYRSLLLVVVDPHASFFRLCRSRSSFSPDDDLGGPATAFAFGFLHIPPPAEPPHPFSFSKPE